MKRLKLTVHKREDLEKLRLAIPRLQLQLLQFQAITVRKLANSILLDEIYRLMEERNFSRKIITGTTVSNIEIRSRRKVRIFFRSEYFSEEGFDVALHREKGTKRHFVKPKGTPTKTFFSTRDKEGRLSFQRGPPIKVALSWIDGGQRYFSKGHYVSGMVAWHTIRRVLKDKAAEFRAAYDEELTDWIGKNMEGVARAV